MVKAAFNKNNSFYQQIGLKFKEETSKIIHLEYNFLWCWNLNTSEIRSQIPGKFSRRMEKIRRTDRVGNEVLYTVTGEMNNLQTIQRTKGNWIGHILYAKWREDEGEDISSYPITLRKRQGTGNWNKKHWIAICAAVAMEEVMDLTSDRLRN